MTGTIISSGNNHFLCGFFLVQSVIGETHLSGAAEVLQNQATPQSARRQGKQEAGPRAQAQRRKAHCYCATNRFELVTSPAASLVGHCLVNRTGVLMLFQMASFALHKK